MTKKELLFAGALGLIIVGSLVVTVFMAFSGGSAVADDERNVWYMCDDCGHSWAIPPEEYGNMIREDQEDPAMTLLDCPKCQARESCYVCRKCPKCDERFIPDTLKEMIHNPRGMADGSGPPVRDVCPHCGADYLEEMRKKYGKR